MHQPVDTIEHRAESGPDDLSISLEAHGFFNQSYDSLDSLLRDITHSTNLPAVEHPSEATVPLVGVPDGLTSIGHLFL
jgi:hypothetical protein